MHAVSLTAHARKSAIKNLYFKKALARESGAQGELFDE
jgi:hypothetical protein